MNFTNETVTFLNKYAKLHKKNAKENHFIRQFGGWKSLKI